MLAIEIVDSPAVFSPWDWIKLLLSYAVLTIGTIVSGGWRDQGMMTYFGLSMAFLATFGGLATLMFRQQGLDQDAVNQFVRILLAFGAFGVLANVAAIAFRIYESSLPGADEPKGILWSAIGVGLGVAGAFLNKQYLDEHGG